VTIHFTADHHFGHANIIEHASRPFDSLHEMNRSLVASWNAVVRPGDTVYHLGDIVWGNPRKMVGILERLTGTIHLVTGNHDKKAALKQPCVNRFASVAPLMEIKVQDPEVKGGRLIVLCHYAMRVWNRKHYGSWHLYGHSHGRLPEEPGSLSFDVGVDCWGFMPIPYERVKAVMASKGAEARVDP